MNCYIYGLWVESIYELLYELNYIRSWYLWIVLVFLCFRVVDGGNFV